MRKFCMIMIALLFMLNSTSNISAAQYGTDFKFKNVNELKDDGWIVSYDKSISLKNGGGIILDGSNTATAITYAEGIPAGVIDWKVGAKCTWLGGKGHSWLNVQVNTEKHTYVYALDGASGQFVLLRDNVRVIKEKGYKEAANEQVQIYMEKNGSSISLSFNSKAVKTYNEAESSEVKSVTISSPAYSAALYSWAGAFIPEPSSEDPSTEPSSNSEAQDIVTQEQAAPGSGQDSEVNWWTYDGEDFSQIYSDLGPNYGVQANPADNTDPSSIPPDEEIPEPPLPQNDSDNTDNQQTDTQAENSGNHNNAPLQEIWIVVNPCLFSMNTKPPVTDYGASAEADNYIMNGVGMQQNVYTADAADQVHCLAEQALANAGLLRPGTHTDYNPYNGNKPDYYVTINTHVSGSFTSAATAQAAVAIIASQVTDANGHVIYENKITANSSAGHNLDYYHCQAAQGINSYLQGAIRK